MFGHGNVSFLCGRIRMSDRNKTLAISGVARFSDQADRLMGAFGQSQVGAPYSFRLQERPVGKVPGLATSGTRLNRRSFGCTF